MSASGGLTLAGVPAPPAIRAGAQIIVFADNVFALREFARKLRCFFIDGPTPQHERLEILKKFRTDPAVSAVFCSKVGTARGVSGPMG